MAIKRKELPKAKRRKPIASIKELDSGKRPHHKQIEKAKRAKAIKVTPRLIERGLRRQEFSLGTQDIEDVAGVVKGFRQQFKASFGVILKDKNDNVIARTHMARGNTTIPEQLVVKALAKYAKSFDEVKIVVSVRKPEAEIRRRKSDAKKSAKQKTKKPVKEKIAQLAKARKASVKKRQAKKSESYTVKGYTKTGKPIKRKAKITYPSSRKKSKK